MTVVDASVWVSYLLPDDANHEASRSWFQRLSPDERLFAPRLLLVEISAGLARRTGSLDIALDAVAAVRSNPLLSIHSLTDDLLESAVFLAGQLRLRAGDAVYVALAHGTGSRLLSWDREQRTRSATVVAALSPAEDLVERE